MQSKKEIQKWLKNRYDDQFIHANLEEMSGIILDYMNDQKLNKADVIKSICPACGSKYYDEDNNVKRCQDCYTIF